MQIAVCSSDENEIGRICSLLNECSVAVRRQATVKVFPSEDLFWDAFRPGCFYGVVVCYGDVKGFLLARRVREEDSDCRVVLLDDTDRYAIRGLRIHLNDFLIRPVSCDQLRATLGRLLGE
jgi:DNA-binding response OmpR family regulator